MGKWYGNHVNKSQVTLDCLLDNGNIAGGKQHKQNYYQSFYIVKRRN